MLQISLLQYPRMAGEYEEGFGEMGLWMREAGTLNFQPQNKAEDGNLAPHLLEQSKIAATTTTKRASAATVLLQYPRVERRVWEKWRR